MNKPSQTFFKSAVPLRGLDGGQPCLLPGRGRQAPARRRPGFLAASRQLPVGGGKQALADSEEGKKFARPGKKLVP